MANSGTIIGDRGGSATSPRLEMDWKVLKQEVGNNRSQVELNLYLRFTHGGVAWTSYGYGGSMSASQGGNLSFNWNSSRISGAGRYHMKTWTVWISHDDIGKRTSTISAKFNIQILWSGKHISTLYLSGLAELPDIPRASSLNSFNINSPLAIGTSNIVNLSLSRKSTSFRHDIELKYGSTTIATWTGQATPTTLGLSGNQVNVILSLMSKTTSGTMSLFVTTKDGSTKIGSTATRNTSVSVSSSVVPRIDSSTFAIAGNGKDKVMNQYIQNISKVTASFTSSATGGASVVSRLITVQRTNGANKMTFGSGGSGTSGLLTQGGEYQVIFEVKDSRGRVAKHISTFTAKAYKGVSFASFSADRETPKSAVVEIKYSMNYPFSESSFATDNFTMRVYYKKASSNDYILHETFKLDGVEKSRTISLSLDVSSSYDIKITGTDEFGKTRESALTVSTASAVLAIDKDIRVGIGKIPERGVLDVGGDMYVEGGIMPIEIPAYSNLNDYKTPNFYYQKFNNETETIANTPSNFAFSLMVVMNNGVTQYYQEYGSADWNSNLYYRNFYDGDSPQWGKWRRVLTEVVG
ncbi:DUF859 family phage minor structural protein [Enterococcus casseliflavus]|uniref:DUF859 family phage minor structural protein n=1 Tax=Enterococcus casseliflavus TaxID=37734 RepID=UPI002DB85EF2|nr:DUF859 family phage minor structural protein [Enterococcus casseliflavus]MEB6213506.1 DUF859 family phage minor structural protein [Enterococcus casseliflavus]